MQVCSIRVTQENVLLLHSLHTSKCFITIRYTAEVDDMYTT